MCALSRWRSSYVGLGLGCIVLASAACSGQPEPEAAPEMPSTVAVDVYLANEALDPACGEVFPVRREVGSADPVRGALEALLAGPTAAERHQGYGGWFSSATAAMLLGVEVSDGVAYVTFADLRAVIPDAATSCGSAGLLAQLDRTLTAFDGIRATRYSLADQTAFYRWLERDDPDISRVPEGHGLPAEPEAPRPSELDLGWSLLEGFAWPVVPGCCSVATTGPVSPAGPIPEVGWPADGFYDVEVERIHDEMLLTLRRWVACSERPELPCGEVPDDAAEDTRIVADPVGAAYLQVPITELRVVLVPIQPLGAQEMRAIDGRPGAFASLLSDWLDPAFRVWVHEPAFDGVPAAEVLQYLLDSSEDPAFPFGIDWCGGTDGCTGPVAFRGPHGVSLLADPRYGDDVGLDRWPPGRNGLYGWSDVTLEVRSDAPILYLWAGQIAG